MTIFRRALCLLVLLSCAAAAAAESGKRPLNYRKRPKAEGAEPQPAGKIPRLLGGRWLPEIDDAVSRLVVVNGSSSTTYDEQVPPAAALSIDGLAYAVGDPAETVFHKLVVEAEFRFSDDFWKQVPLGYGRQKIRAAYEQFSPQPKAVWHELPTYRQYVKYFLASYLDTCAKVGRKECRGYLAKLVIGFTDEELRDYAKAALDAEAKEKPRVESYGEFDGDPEAIKWHRGLAPLPELPALVKVLRGAGFDVWAVSSAAEAIADEAGERAGIDPSRAIGIKQALDRGKNTGDLREPIPVRSGEVDALVHSLGRAPILVVGARPEDLDLLQYSAQLRVFVDWGWREAEVRALEMSALVQPPFEAAAPAPKRVKARKKKSRRP